MIELTSMLIVGFGLGVFVSRPANRRVYLWVGAAYTLMACLVGAQLAFAQPVRSILIVTAADQAQANLAAAEVDPVGGLKAFTVPLENALGVTVAYVANWQFKDGNERDQLMASFIRRGIRARVVSDDYSDPDPASNSAKLEMVLTREGMKRPDTQIGARR